jgi:FAD-linked oxidoreductase
MKNGGEWRNWSGSEGSPASILQPRDEAELAQALRRHAYVRPLGAGHSFMPLCAPHAPQSETSRSALIHLGQIAGEIAIAADRQTALVPAGWSIARITEQLWAHGLSLPNQGDVNPQALAGAMATGTHGTGNDLGSLSTMARGFRLMDAQGDLHWCDARQQPDLFAAQRLSLGLLGVATQVRVAVVPAFHLAESVEARPMAEVYDAYDAWSAQNRHAEFWVFPHSDTAIVKRLIICDPCAPPESTQDIGETLFRHVLNLCALMPRATPMLQRLMMKADISGARQGPAYRIFPSDRTIRFEEMEYEIPRADGMAALKAVIAWIRKHHLPLAFPFEYRTVAGDDIDISPMNAGPVAAISMHQYAKMEWRGLFREAEAIFRDHGGRPHWAKRHRLTRDDVDVLYPRAEAFRAVRRAMDPQGKFLNSHLRDLWE